MRSQWALLLLMPPVNQFFIIFRQSDYFGADRRSRDMERLPRKPFADLTSQELYQRADEYRDMARNARGRAVAAALERLAIRYGLAAIHREIDQTGPVQAAHNDALDHTELAKLVALADQAAKCEPNPIECLATVIRNTVASNADPYLVIGALLEGTVQTICARIPRERLNNTAEACVRLLQDRLQANGLAQGSQ
jgi:hypothetical protein